MMTLLSRLVVVLLSCLMLTCVSEAQQSPGQERVNPDAQVLQDFKDRIDKYIKLRKQLEDQGPSMKETEDPARIKAWQDTLATNMRSARKGARPGEIFTPEIRALFRRLMYPETKGREGAETKQTIKEDAPAPGSVPFKVNAKYPEDEPLPTVPPNLLAALPKLPDGLEYRIVRNHLILRDAHANLIVDFIPNAIR
jgi:hypothetical protein